MIPGGRTRSSLAPFFPLPLVGAAVLLAVLILLTPNLLSTGSPAAGSLESQPELIVDRAPTGGNGTYLYLEGIGLARFASLSLTWYPLNGSTAPPSLAGLPGGVPVNGTELLGLSTRVPVGAFAVNVSARFMDATRSVVVYVGSWAFRWSGDLLITTAYGPVDGASPTRLAQLPLVLLLAVAPSGGSR